MNRNIITIAVSVLSLAIGYTIGAQTSGESGTTTPAGECTPSAIAAARTQTPAANPTPTPVKEEPIVLPEVSTEDAEAAFEIAGPLFREKKYDDAISDLTTAAKGGVPQAEYYLGMAHQKGLGTEVNHVQAYYWLTLAQIHRLKAARTPMNQLSRIIKNEDKEAAKAMVQEWKVKQKAIQSTKRRLAAEATK